MSDKEFNTENESGGVDKKRRSLTKIGLSTPVIASLLSRPAFATQCSGSALASGNLSNPVDKSTCGACSPLQWTKATQAELDSISINLANSINTLFTIPNFTPPGAGSIPKPIITGTIGGALNGSITIDSGFTAGNNTQTTTAKAQLIEAFKQFVTAFLNASHIATKINFPKNLSTVVSEVNSALTITTNGNNFSLNMTTINSLKDSYTLANSGTSCSINYK
ncbi:MAG: hypothetical protein Q7U98_15660 [Methylicorpusculum sp.]|uniref:hypothetical protein n=1 Tax=Methylicorpusculum sp. TaxID=2713644 RepID=UPI0027270409|nr:hypothetical protein [Methylicorpusculum sp.]MDO8940591.1 hypothetical protein [Methylicorpusculum sp.]MDP2180475.1 hypothetical protein [Methylicorpusculum sp.]MDP2200530.1 hypothetical protein [Methylicorpusculum sp.]MDP3527904.1 hypothetical protein [Methylicorpusculum sp.]MDZ4153670.1 hypothetical protein [Methylicorpusculum sp.]